MAKRIIVNPVTRIEGHAKIILEVADDGSLSSGHMQVLEIRGFEKLLQGMELLKMPQMTARLCGVCPAAHHLVATIGIEQGMGVTPPADAKLLRELLYAGHVLHSHALSNFVLTGPDIILGIGAEASKRNVFSLLAIDPDLSKTLLRIRSIGQRTVEAVGGRGVHPVTAVPGGMASRPSAEQLALIAGWGEEATISLQHVVETLKPKLDDLEPLRQAAQLPYHSLALSNNGAVDLLEGEWVVVDPEGNEERRFAGPDYGDHLVEHVMPGSYMKSVQLKGPEAKHFFVGPLARLNVNATMSSPKAQEALDAFRAVASPRLSAVDFIEARLIDMLNCAERMAAIAGSELGDGPIRTEVPKVTAGRYAGVIEAPRGILVHDYITDDDGRVAEVNLIVATQNNYDAIDSAVESMARHYLPEGDDDTLLNGVEFAMRCFDPCLACATHTAGRMPMTVEVRRGDAVLRTIRRGGAS
ncbi:MAG: Ni/Fe hydrogenase subunit alpha [Thermoanaerobaculales bacterium]|jgi:F420-non-reducing hydrogenase large subunit|nr:Ni/Fe hydrogenase subunit alpha [Thermoanaerobaculales bacterium]